ncbi:MAG: hypothetical protein Q9220_001585 [cf. Caloplaca sp. 1 TL-2023]
MPHFLRWTLFSVFSLGFAYVVYREYSRRSASISKTPSSKSESHKSGSHKSGSHKSGSHKSSSSASSRCSCCSSSSYPSTVTYEQEPFESFAPRVRELCHQLWPSTSGDFVIERMKGGSFNRIIGIDVPHPDANRVPDRYILRVSRFDLEDTQQQRETAIIRYVQEHTSIPTAEIVFTDPTSDNPLKVPYVIQSRIPGQNLQQVYPTLTHEQKRAVARQWAQILRATLAVKHGHAGFVDAVSDEDGVYAFSINPFKVRFESYCEQQDRRLITKESTVRMLTEQFKRLDTAEIRRAPEQRHLDYYERLVDVAESMEAQGLFTGTFFSLCHLDLEPRNVLIDFGPDDAATMTGVLDWDSAVFAPNFVACAPPSWIWAWNSEEDEDESKANETPESMEDQELKQDFEAAVGDEYLKFAYSPQYRSARTLFNLALNDVRSNETHRDAVKLVNEWVTSRQDPPVPYLPEFKRYASEMKWSDHEGIPKSPAGTEPKSSDEEDLESPVDNEHDGLDFMVPVTGEEEWKSTMSDESKDLVLSEHSCIE